MFPSLDGANIEQFSKAKKVIKIIEIQKPEQDGQLSVYLPTKISELKTGPSHPMKKPLNIQKYASVRLNCTEGL